MKKYTLFVRLIVAVIIMFFFSCHKEHNKPVNQQGEQYNVNMRIGFNVNVTNFNVIKKKALSTLAADSVSDTLQNYLSVLYYHVYDSNMHEVRDGIQQSTNTDFGNISYKLPNGTYTVIVDGGASGFEESGTISSSDTTYFMLYSYTNTSITTSDPNYSPFKANTFYQKFALTVNNSSVTTAINLSRIVGQLKIIIQDAIPVNAQSITAIVNGDAESLDLNMLVPNFNSNLYFYHNATPIVAGATNTTIYAYIANTTSPFSVELKSTAGIINSFSQLTTNTIIADKLIPNVTCKANETTVLTGDLFEQSSDGFTITYNPTWGGTTNIGF